MRVTHLLVVPVSIIIIFWCKWSTGVIGGLFFTFIEYFVYVTTGQNIAQNRARAVAEQFFYLKIFTFIFHLILYERSWIIQIVSEIKMI